MFCYIFNMYNKLIFNIKDRQQILQIIIYNTFVFICYITISQYNIYDIIIKSIRLLINFLCCSTIIT